jgi:hypothetical protein
VQQTRALIHLEVTDVARCASFYEALFRAPPRSRNENVTVFEMEEPMLVLTLETPSAGSHRPAGKLGKGGGQRGAPARRFALFVAEPELVGRVAVSLWRAGARLRLLDEGIETIDPSGNAWRVRLETRAKERRARVAEETEDADRGERPERKDKGAA